MTELDLKFKYYFKSVWRSSLVVYHKARYHRHQGLATGSSAHALPQTIWDSNSLPHWNWQCHWCCYWEREGCHMRLGVWSSSEGIQYGFEVGGLGRMWVHLLPPCLQPASPVIVNVPQHEEILSLSLYLSRACAHRHNTSIAHNSFSLSYSKVFITFSSNNQLII
jgi:hypothetical protein